MFAGYKHGGDGRDQVELGQRLIALVTLSLCSLVVPAPLRERIALTSWRRVKCSII